MNRHDWFMTASGDNVFCGEITRESNGGVPPSFRPVVVIDPEDVEQVIDLVRAFIGERPWSSTTEDMQKALRSLIADPKPDEPHGIGAVVEDADGVRWTRVEGCDQFSRNPWYPAAADDLQPEEYADIAAVRVLSEGVTA